MATRAWWLPPFLLTCLLMLILHLLVPSRAFLNSRLGNSLRSRSAVCPPRFFGSSSLMSKRTRGLTRVQANANSKTVMVCIADGSEEVETSGIFDTLIRGGVDVTLAKVGGDKANLICKMSRGMSFVAERHFEELSPANEKFDMVVLPGGLPGAQAFSESEKLVSELQQRKEAGEWYAAICASPAVVFAPNGLLPEKATCFPALHEKISSHLSDGASTSRVVVDPAKKVVTSQGPGTTLEFAVELVSILMGDDKADEVAKGLLIERTGKSTSG